MQQPASDGGAGDPLDDYMATLAPAATAQAGPRLQARPPPAASGAVSSNAQLRNRRYAALTAMLASGDDFFSDAAMEERAPALYHEVLGRHQALGVPSTAGTVAGTRAGAAAAAADGGGGPLTVMLMSALDRQRNSGARGTSEGGIGGGGGGGGGDDAGQASDAAGIGVPHSSDGMLVTEAGQRAMLLSLMTERFLRGDEAAHFEYAAVDGREELDVHLESVRDAEARYFDGSGSGGGDSDGDEDTGSSRPPPP